jgi:hypothetical protein
MAETSLILDYQVAREERPSFIRRLVGLVLNSPLVALPFLPFAFEISPCDVLREVASQPRGNLFIETELALLAAPFFLAILLVWVKARMWFMALTRVELRIMQIVTLAMYCAEIWTAARLTLTADFHDPRYALPSIGFLVSLAITLALGIFQQIRRVQLETLVHTFMAFSFLANTIFCLAWFSENRSVGYYVTIYACGLVAFDLLAQTTNFWTWAGRTVRLMRSG